MTSTGVPRRLAPWIWLTCDGLLVAAAIAWVVTGWLWTLLVWEAIGVLYVAVGLALVWRGSPERSGSPEDARAVARLAWVLPILASGVGAYSALVALIARTSSGAGTSGQIVLAIVASVAVVLSWLLLQIGFATIYQSLDESDPTVDAIEFPGRDTTAFLNYLYFSFTVGTAFATSDARVMTLAVRRIVLIHSVVAFFYNALVVATAIQVLQQLVAG